MNAATTHVYNPTNQNAIQQYTGEQLLENNIFASNSF